jgi:hypothetical protein
MVTLPLFLTVTGNEEDKEKRKEIIKKKHGNTQRRNELLVAVYGKEKERIHNSNEQPSMRSSEKVV